jgi:hypothetical protein
METITYIKKDALIPITIGTSFTSRLQQALIFLTDDKTESELEVFKRALTDKIPLDGWMLHCETLALLIKEIEDSAIDKGMTEDKDIEVNT